MGPPRLSRRAHRHLDGGGHKPRPARDSHGECGAEAAESAICCYPIGSAGMREVIHASGRPSLRGSRGSRLSIVANHANNAYIVGMATLNIRNLPEEVHRRLRVRAAEHGRSMEAEARSILTDACVMQSPAHDTATKVAELQAFIDKLYAGKKPKNVVDEFIAERRREAAREASE